MAKRAAIVRLNYYPHDLLVRREAMALQSIGYHVDVYCLRGRGSSEEVIDGIHVHHLPLERKKEGAARNLFEYITFFFLAALRLTVSHLRRPFTVIQVNTMPDFLAFATLVPRLLGAKVTLVMYEPMPELWATKFDSPFAIQILQWIEQWSLRYVHAAFAVTQTLKDKFVSRGADPQKITIVLNVSDSHIFGVIPPHPAASNSDHFTLICHGAIEERYGHDTMLQAVASIRQLVPGLRLRITGGGSYCDTFLAQIEALELQDHAQYLGYLPLDQLVAELSQADIGIVAQKASPYSHLVHTGKMYDYLTFGKPVIASRLKAVRAYFDEDSLRFFEPGDPNDLAQAILDLFRHPDKRKALVANSQKLFEQYKWEKQKELYLSVYRKWLE